MNKEVIKQVLEALDIAQALLESAKSRHHPQVLEAYNALQEAQQAQPTQQEPEMVAAFRSSHAYTVGFQDGKTQAQQEPVAHAVIAGALFDFMGWLTSRKERLLLSSSDDASPAVVVITEFAKMRGLSLDDAKVIDWNATLQPPAERKPLSSAEMNQIEARWDACMHGSKVAFVVRETEAAHGITKGGE